MVNQHIYIQFCLVSSPVAFIYTTGVGTKVQKAGINLSWEYARHVGR